MKRIVSMCGQAWHALASDRGKALLTVQGGHMTAEFKGTREALTPFILRPGGKSHTWRTGVIDILRKDGETVTIVGRTGRKIDVPCSVDWLKEGKE